MFTGSDWSRLSEAYQTVTTVFPVAAGGLDLLLPANSRRWYLEIRGFTGAADWLYVFPGPVPPNTVATVRVTQPQIYKGLDCPSIVTGEFYAWRDGVTQYMTTECLYVGG